ncbi:hypothetical protein OJ997_33940 [Solirubrobacter phytolaccae]|uniref:LTXXQ motif family protein n=1 Tax=Solirubrobacter phytolaccae TaxID=1404360 RepID=A0A9X3SJK0_9ACTN|nr:hypothetical protein [Solirubrobacter phytolaccae]MDA0185357.1 hypothetical protein [Solirubrobacter phytolaccae]
MSRRTRTAAVLLSSAALLGSGVPAQAHGGDRGDRGQHAGKRHGKGDRGFARAARELGVSKEQLKTAVKAASEQQKAAGELPSYKAVVASKLGVTEDQLKTAFEQAKQSADSRDAFKAAFASALGKDVATVETAFKDAKTELKQQWQARYDAWVASVAQQLGKSPEEVKAAFESKRGHHKGHHKGDRGFALH